MAFRLELIVPDDKPADVGFDLRTTTTEQGIVAVTMLRTVANKLEQHMSLKKTGSAAPIEVEPTDDQSSLAKTATEQWTPQDAEHLRSENEGDQDSE